MRRRSALHSPVNDEFHCSLPLRTLAIACCLSFLVALPGAQADSNNPALEEEQEDSLDDSVNTPSADVVADTWVPPQRHPEAAVTWVQPESGLSLPASEAALPPTLVEPPRVIMHAKLPHKAAAEFGVHRPKLTSSNSGGAEHHHHHHGTWAKHFGKKHREVTEAEKTHASPKPLDPKQALMAYRQNLVRQSREHEGVERRARLIIIENEHKSSINATNSTTFIFGIFVGLSVVACMIKFGIFVR